MTQYHINEGEARVCRIIKRACPYGGSHLTRQGVIKHVERTGQKIELVRSDYTLTYRKTPDGVRVHSSLTGLERPLGQPGTRRRKSASTTVQEVTPPDVDAWTRTHMGRQLQERMASWETMDDVDRDWNTVGQGLHYSNWDGPEELQAAQEAVVAALARFPEVTPTEVASLVTRDAAKNIAWVGVVSKLEAERAALRQHLNRPAATELDRTDLAVMDWQEELARGDRDPRVSFAQPTYLSENLSELKHRHPDLYQEVVKQGLPKRSSHVPMATRVTDFLLNGIVSDFSPEDKKGQMELAKARQTMSVRDQVELAEHYAAKDEGTYASTGTLTAVITCRKHLPDAPMSWVADLANVPAPRKTPGRSPVVKPTAAAIADFPPHSLELDVRWAARAKEAA